MSKSRSNLRFKEFAKAAAAGAFVGAVALQPVAASANTGSVQVKQANVEWFVNTNITFSTTSSNWGLSEASMHTAAAATANSYNRNDAFDGVLSWHVFPSGSVPGGPDSHNGYKSPGGVVSVVTNANGTTVTGTTQSLAGLTVQGEMHFSPTKAVVRSMLVLQNPTGAPISVVVGNYNNLGSDSSTHLLDTSSGDAAFSDSTDNWVVSCQASEAPPACDPDRDPVVTFALQDGAPSSIRASTTGANFADGNDNPDFNYSLTVPAGATRRLVVFMQLSDNSAHALADAPSFNSATTLSSTDYLYGLTAPQLAEVVNWKFLATPTLSVTSGLNPSSYTQPVTFTATLASGSSPTGTVTVCADDATCAAPVASCTATVTGTTASCSISSLPAGSHSITAIYSGDALNSVATSAPLTQQVNPASQTISFGAQPPQTFVGGGKFVLSPVATASSGLPVSYASTTTSVCTISNTTVTILAMGTCTINASQAGNGSYAAAPTVAQNITIGTLQLVPTPTLGRWALLLMGGLLGLVARFYRRGANRR